MGCTADRVHLVIVGRQSGKCLQSRGVDGSGQSTRASGHHRVQRELRPVPYARRNRATYRARASYQSVRPQESATRRTTAPRHTLERIDLGKTRVSEPRAPTHHSQFGWSARPAPGTHASEPLECGPACLGRVAESPRVWQEHVSELGLLAFWPDMPQTLGVAAVESDHADHDSVEIDDEKPGLPPGISGTARSSWSVSRFVLIGDGGQAAGPSCVIKEAI